MVHKHRSAPTVVFSGIREVEKKRVLSCDPYTHETQAVGMGFSVGCRMATHTYTHSGCGYKPTWVIHTHAIPYIVISQDCTTNFVVVIGRF